jgi:hypothetical protein
MIRLFDFPQAEGYQKLQAAIDQSGQTGETLFLDEQIETPVQILHRENAKVFSDGASLKAVSAQSPVAVMWRMESNKGGQKLLGDFSLDGDGIATNYLISGIGNNNIELGTINFKGHKGALNLGASQTQAFHSSHLGRLISRNPVSIDWFTVNVSRSSNRPQNYDISADLIDVEGLFGAGVRGDQIAIHGTDDFSCRKMISRGGDENGVTISKGCLRPVIGHAVLTDNDKHGIDFGASTGVLILNDMTGLSVGDEISKFSNGATATVSEIHSGFLRIESMFRLFKPCDDIMVNGQTRTIVDIGSVRDASVGFVEANNNGIDRHGEFNGEKPLGGVYQQHAQRTNIGKASASGNPWGMYNAASHAHAVACEFLESNVNGDVKNVGTTG